MRITVDEFWKSYPFQPYELIRGKVTKSESLGFRYSIVGMRIEAKLTEFVEGLGLGDVLGAHNGYRLSDYTLRAPRVSFITREKWKRITHPYSYLPFAPDIAVEIATLNTTEREIREMCAPYVRAGTQYVWVCQPDLQRLTVYSRYENPRVFTRKDNLRLPKWHPDFIIPLSELLPKPRRFN
jgi:Uma2 family endonuclease